MQLREQPVTVLSDSDIAMHHWFLFGLTYALCVTVVEGILVTLLATYRRQILRRPLSGLPKVLTYSVVVLFFSIKLIYYFVWVIDGLMVYSHIEESEVSLKAYRLAIGYLACFNFLDLLRNIITIIVLIVMHCVCKKRALKERLRMEALYEEE